MSSPCSQQSVIDSSALKNKRKLLSRAVYLQGFGPVLSVVKPHYPVSCHILHFNVVNPIITSEKERILEPKHVCIKNSTELNRIELN